MGSIRAKRALRIGVDVGGTNTDAVLLDLDAVHQPNRGVLAWHKTPTTSPNVTDGIETAVGNVLKQAKDRVSEISCLIVGTTHFLNAVIERDVHRLSKVAVIRLSRSYTRDIPPFSDFPPVLADLLHGYHGYVDGGLHIDGAQEAPINEEQVLKECEAIERLGINAVVISGIFSPIDQHFHQESRVRDIIQKRLSNVDVVCSSEVSNIGLLERENASILNASILKFARRTIRGFRAAMRRLKLDCTLFISQNDGTVLDSVSAAKLPIKTFSSGPTNSMRGAAYLGLGQLGLQGEERTSTIVIDVGGTTTDCGVLLPSGFPRAASAYVSVAGVTMNFPMPHLESIGLGGGSIIRERGTDVSIGPDSVGYQLTTKSRVFGGDTCTATDVAVAGGLAVGDPKLVGDIQPEMIQRVRARTKKMLERVIDRLKLTPAPLPVLLVGGGSVICPLELEGVSQVVVPNFHSVANAVGAAISRVCGSVDAIYSITDMSLSEVIEDAKAQAVAKAVKGGADSSTVTVVEIDTLPIPYVSGQIRVLVKAVGDLSLDYVADSKTLPEAEDDASETLADQVKDISLSSKEEIARGKFDFDAYRPLVRRNTDTGVDEWIVSETDLEWLSVGCYILGCAGGGSPKAEFLKLRDQVRAGGKVRIIDSSSLREDALVYWGGMMGSPAVSIERLNSSECITAVADLMEYLGHKSFDAVMGLEIGGANGLEPLLIGSSQAFNRPVIDADWMGRAYPTYWQTTIAVHESGQLTPCAIASGDGKTIIMTKSPDDEIVDRALRASCSEMGSRVGMAAKPTTTDRVRSYGVINTLSLSWRIGRTVARAQQESTIHTVAEQIIDEVGGPTTAKILFRGKIVAVERRVFKGHSYGEITIAQTDEDEEEQSYERAAVAEGGVVKIPFKNENIYAKHIADDGTETYLATVPDLISVLDTQSGCALGVPEFRYGLLVTTPSIPASLSSVTFNETPSVQRPEPIYYTPRRKQACSRCHTKRIKCLGGVPCRNCTLSDSPCIFPPPRKSRNSASQQGPVSPSNSLKDDHPTSTTAANGASLSVTAKTGSYRRSEKDFSSRRLDQARRVSRQTYRASPSCRTFVEQFIAWVAVQKLQLNPFDEASFNPSWASLGHLDSGLMNPGLEISIDTEVSHPSAQSEASRPVKIRMPPYNHSIHLLQCVEFAIGHDQHYFRRQHIRARVTQMYQNPDSSRSKDRGWLCFWLAILAVGELYNSNGYTPADDGLGLSRSSTSPDKEPPGAEYYHQSVSFLQQVAENPDVLYIETLCLLAVYAFSMNKINTAYMYNGLGLRAALSLGLHRSSLDFLSEGSDLRIAESEHQRRVFWTVYYQDLLTSSTTGRPWGILDDEITTEYADSTRISGDSMMEFFDSEESNAHLELMRLRGQAYSSLYGYAGTAINPYSHISLFDFDLGNSLSQQHLDKMDEFHQGLIAWQQELPGKLKLARSFEGSGLNPSRVTANLHLIYHQTILVLLRPVLVNIHNDSFEVRSKEYSETIDANPGLKSMLRAFYIAILDSARETAGILEWLQYQGALFINSYFDASYAFTAAIALYLARTLRSFTYPNQDALLFTDEDLSALNTIVGILRQQSLAGNVPAKHFDRQLRLLENNLQALQTALDNRSMLLTSEHFIITFRVPPQHPALLSGTAASELMSRTTHNNLKGYIGHLSLFDLTHRILR
ncbi:Fungal Zn2-Cys6 binuclear cluster domain-containing protein isoform 3 [Cladophialophora immunda]|nr:Fungal Zn2-Cys6 binuclear cluster domain-containing protein isoform 3 [Cladophialophora immunda]